MPEYTFSHGVAHLSLCLQDKGHCADLFANCLCFRIGRRKTLYITIWLLLASGTALAFAPEFISFCVLIFLVGAGNLGLYMTAYVLGKPVF